MVSFFLRKQLENIGKQNKKLYWKNGSMILWKGLRKMRLERETEATFRGNSLCMAGEQISNLE